MKTRSWSVLAWTILAAACGGETTSDLAAQDAVGDEGAVAAAPGSAATPTFSAPDNATGDAVSDTPDGISPDDRYVVRLEDERGRSAITAVGGSIVLEVDEATVAAQLTPAQLELLRGQPGVAEVDVDPRRYLQGAAEKVPYGVQMVQADRVQFDPAAPIGVCIVDSGYFAGHEDLADDATGTPDVGTRDWDVDGCGHGTHVAGTIAALKNGLGVQGVAPDAVRVHVVKVFGDNCAWTYSSSLVRAVYECVRAGNRVINMSLGGPSPYWFEELAFEWAHLKGVLSVAAAGNAGGTAKSYPASYEHVISVGAVNAQGGVASFSQRNAAVDLAAPGVAVLSTVPDAGVGTYQAWSGTSMATPHVSGVAALLWSRNPSWTNQQIRDALQSTAFDIWPPGRDDGTGHGIVQAAKALAALDSSCADGRCEGSGGSGGTGSGGSGAGGTGSGGSGASGGTGSGGSGSGGDGPVDCEAVCDCSSP